MTKLSDPFASLKLVDNWREPHWEHPNWKERTRPVTNNKTIAEYLRKTADKLKTLVDTHLKIKPELRDKEYSKGYLAACLDLVDDLGKQADRLDQAGD